MRKPTVKFVWPLKMARHRRRLANALRQPVREVCLITTLPNELQFAICNDIDQSGAIKLSSTCSFYREFLAHRIFNALRLEATDPSSATAVKAIWDGKHAAHVRELHYSCSYESPPCSNHQEKEHLAFQLLWDRELVLGLRSKGYVLDYNVSYVLSHLKRFPNLSTLVIGFDFDWFWQLGEEHGNHINNDASRSRDEVLMDEKVEAWRALMVESYAAVQCNKELQHLHIKDLPPTEISTFTNEKFHKFLGRVKRFELSVGNPVPSCPGCNAERLDGYNSFMEDLGEFFFNHLSQATHLKLRPHEEASLAVEHPLPLPVAPKYMPLLTAVSLERTAICEELISCFIGHKSTLESITLDDCFSTAIDLYHEGNYATWDELLTSLWKARPTKLKELRIFPTTAEMGDGWQDIGDDAEDERDRICQILEKEPERRFFVYSSIEDGMDEQSKEDGYTNRQSFLLGEDQMAYDKLMGLVANNRKNLGKD